MKNVQINNMIKFSIVLSLDKPKHGYELIIDLEKKLGRKISASQIYPFLKQLKKNKYIEIKSSAKRDKKVYVLTKDGRRFLKALLDKFGNLLDVAVKSRIEKCSHCSCEIYSGGYEKQIGRRKRLFCCKHCASD